MQETAEPSAERAGTLEAGSDSAVDSDNNVGPGNPAEALALNEQDLPKPAPVHWPLQSEVCALFVTLVSCDLLVPAAGKLYSAVLIQWTLLLA